MKKLAFLLLIMVFSVLTNVSAQTYQMLWKQVEEAQKKDLPQTAIRQLKPIREKALKEKSYGNFLRSALLQTKLQTEIAPDSLLSEVQKLENIASTTADKVLRAVCCVVLCQIYEQETTAFGNDWKTKADSCRHLAMANPVLLAQTPTADYTPFVLDAKTVDGFGHDMLSVVAGELDVWTEAQAYYEQAGNRRAACLAAYFAERSQSADDVATLDSLISRYAEEKEVGWLAVERVRCMMRNEGTSTMQTVAYIDQAIERWGTADRLKELLVFRHELTAPQYSANIDETLFIPHVSQTIRLRNLRHLTSLTLRVYRTTLQGDSKERIMGQINDEAYRRIRQGLVEQKSAAQTRTFAPRPEYELFNDSVTLAGLPAGIYLLEFSIPETKEVQRHLCCVSNLRTMIFAQPDGKMRYVVVNATTGQPVAGAKLRIGDGKKAMMLTTNAAGEAFRTATSKDNWTPLFAYTAQDKYCPKLYSDRYPYGGQSTADNIVELFTDRSIYRPGQTVHVAAIAYRVETDKQTHALNGKTYTLKLYDARGRNIAEKQLTTDEYGKASSDFLLPEQMLTGNCRLNMGGCNQNIRVETYKRPTFDVAFDEYKERYAAGDTITVSARAKTYSGVAVQQAKVRYQVRRQQSWWWRSMDGDNGVVATGETTTDADGLLKVNVPLVLSKKEDKTPRFYQFVVEADITDLQGETRQATMSLPLGTRSSVLTTTLPSKIRKDQNTPWRINRFNAAGQTIGGKVKYRIDQNPWQTVEANDTVGQSWTAYTSGKHHLEAVCEGDTLQHDFVLFSLDDHRPAVQTDEWFYVSHDRFPADGSPVTLQVGSSDADVYMAYEICVANKVVEKGFRRENGTLWNRKLTYKPEYGDGIQLSFVWVKNGKYHRHTTTLYAPEPDNKLTLRWETFRNRLLPGQQEEWRLHVADSKGRSATAQLMAVLYDKSLDALAKHQWSFTPRIYYQVPYGNWRILYSSSLFLDYSLPCPYVVNDIRSVGVFDHSVYPYRMMGMVLRSFATNGIRMKEMAKQVGRVYEAVEESADRMESVVMESKMKDSGMAKIDENNTHKPVALRENMTETAFFYPTLATDTAGMVTIRFTMPETLTTWRFMGVAHTKDIRTGYIESEIVAQKQIMVETNLPRFIREGDNSQWNVRIANLSNSVETGTVRLELLDAETEKVVYTEDTTFSVDAGKNTSATFHYQADGNHPLLICRIIANGQNHSDGEQRYLAVLPATERVIVTQPITQYEAGGMTLNIDKLFAKTATHRKLTIEYTNNPVWMMVQALAAAGQPSEKSAIGQAAAYYSNFLAKSLVNRLPQVKHVFELWRRETEETNTLQAQLMKNQELRDLLLDEIPWATEADNEREQKRQLADFFNDYNVSNRLEQNRQQLQRLQNADGGFAWYEGMRSNDYITMEVAQMLARLSFLTGEDSRTNVLLRKAMDYMDKRMLETVTELKRREAKRERITFPGDNAFRWLYVNAISKRQLSTSVRKASDYLITLLRKESKRISIYGKATQAIILHQQGLHTEAANDVKSIKEYSVYNKEVGRYFDTPRAFNSWYSYKIPTEVAAIEALHMVSPDDETTIEEMRRWLLQQKRTQQWDTPINTVNAIYAFLQGNEQVLATPQPVQMEIDGKPLELPKATAGMGYVKTTIQPSEGKTLTIRKPDNNASWGAVYAQSLQPIKQITATNGALTIERQLVGGPSMLHVGDRIKVRITIETKRNLDFVEVVDKRAACLEPVGQLSGYLRGAYCAPKDGATYYFFEKLPKGKHVIETEYYVDRAGCYETGTCTAQCAYAPEYQATGASMTLNIE